MTNFHKLLIFFIVMSSLINAKQDDSRGEKAQYASLIAKADRDIPELKRQIQDNSNGTIDEKYSQLLFDAYMHKATGHFHLGERDKQLKCYQEILGTKGLSKLTLARTHVNISVVQSQLKRCLLAAAQLKKAEELAAIQDIAQIIGGQTYNVFVQMYTNAGEELYDHPEQALDFQKRALQIPEQDEHTYAILHLKLAFLYEKLSNSKDSLTHVLQTLKCKFLSPAERDEALCLASIASAEAGKRDDCIRYFQQIADLKRLNKNERFLVLLTVGSCYLSDKKWDIGIRLRYQALDVLDPTSPECLLVKYNLATAYGESGDKEKELDLYGEVLEEIKSKTFDKNWQEGMQSTQMLIEASFFMKEMDEFERRLREHLDQRSKERETIRSQEHQKALEEEKLKSKQGKEKRHQQFIKQIKLVQRGTVEREQKLGEERKKKVEADRIRAEERKRQVLPRQELSIVESSSSQSESYVPEHKIPRVKTRGVGAQPEILEEAESASSEPILPTLPKMGVCAQTVFSQIEDEDWSFTREDYEHYLEDLYCKRRETGSSHRVFQLPKTTIITLERNGEEVSEQIFWADEDIKLGSTTLPPWKGKQIPFYLRKQLRSFHEKVVINYAKVTAIVSSLHNSHSQ